MPGGNGLFDRFDAYRTPTESDIASVLNTGLVTPDTNVLLDLYRCSDRARADLLALLDALGDRLWVPHQVLVEFWRNRESVLTASRTAGDLAADELAEQLAASTRTLRAWADRAALPDVEFDRLVAVLTTACDEVRAAVVRVVEDAWRGIEADTGSDPVIARLESALAGRVGPALSERDHADEVAEAMRRVAERRPPGYMDAHKDGTAAAGDHLVWAQVVAEAARRGHDVLFVTGDRKEDWWREERGIHRGPRPELAEELRARGGGRLFMVSPADFLAVAAYALRVPLGAGSVEDLDRIARVDAAAVYGGWSPEALTELFERLVREGYANRVEVIRCAVAAGGFVDRSTARAVCGYDADHRLIGFERPIGRIAIRLRHLGHLPADAVDVLTAIHDADHAPASGFTIHPLLLPLAPDVLDAFAPAGE